MKTQGYHSDTERIGALLDEKRRTELFRYLQRHRKLFTRHEYGKIIIVVSELPETKYGTVKTSLENQVAKREKEGIDYLDTYKI